MRPIVRTVIILSLLIFTATAAPAEEVAYFDHYPKIQRLQGAILFPADIKEVTIRHDDGGVTTNWKCTLYHVKDVGQKVHQNRSQFVKENKRYLYELSYGDLETVVRAIEEDRVTELKAAADKKVQDFEAVETLEPQKK
ncbi:MAG: hypothetical protein U5L07_07685 [Desulfobacterales bacterium]|nr:hypothetical protein [Desulfobacterales bacterium]